MPDQLTSEQQEELRRAVEWRDTVCPKGLLDPLTGALHANTIQKIGAYINRNGGDGSPAWLSKAVEALWSELIWFGTMPPKPQPKRTLKPPLEPPPPLQPWDARRLREEQKAEDEKRNQKIQKATAKALEKAKKAKENERPGAVFFPEGHPRSGQINHRASQEHLKKWKDAHGIID